MFSDETLDNLMDYDAQSYQAITREFSYWDEIDFHFHGERRALDRSRLLRHRAPHAC